MATYNTKVIIIGSGPAGATAAIYAVRAGLNPILVHGIQPGGQLTTTTDVENYPGFPDPINGPWLMEQMIKQCENLGVQLVQDVITSVDFSKRPFLLTGSNNEYIADSVIIATGAQAKWLGLESEEFFKGFGVSGCATCDGFFFRGKEVAVIGGGNTAIEEALYLSHHVKKVTVIHRRDSFRAEKIMQERLFANSKIDVIWNSVIDEIVGTKMPKSVNGVILRDINTGNIKELKLDGVFVAIGHKPNTDMFKQYLEIDNDGYIVTRAGSTATNIVGVFACGDVQDKIFRQAITAAGTGCMAALEAEKLLSH